MIYLYMWQQFLNCQAIFVLLIFFNIPSQDKSRELVIEMVLLGWNMRGKNCSPIYGLQIIVYTTVFKATFLLVY